MLYLIACPGGTAQKREAGLYTWVTFKAVEVDLVAQVLPAIHFYQMLQHHLQRNAVQRVVLLFFCHTAKVRISAETKAASSGGNSRIRGLC